uniref:Cobyrinate a,c-diamide synthase n=1 Tax=Geoglobus ahangari TaxID=113653 RepID=A0A7C3YCN0_9EURY
MHAFVVAGTHSGVGKTTVAMCIAAALKKRGMRVQPFKVGPDFIDPTHYSFCEWAVNLDAFIMGEDGVRESFSKWMNGKDVGIVEGVMGLFDGYKLSDFASTAHVAKILNLPVVLVMDVRGMSLSALALFEGYKKFDKELKVVGAIFNGGTAFHEKLKRVFEAKGYKVFGILPKIKDLEIKSRHLGLHLGMESKKDWKILAEICERYIDVDGILEVSGINREITEELKPKFAKAKKKVIGIPFDEAFAFYYRDNLEILSNFGDLKFFSPLKGETVECDAYYIGGGYPELYDLSNFAKFIRKEALDEKPIYAECGGMMLLARKIEIDEGTKKMAGVIDVDVIFTKKLQALGYINGEVISKNPFFTGKFKGHEFHYSYAIADEDVKFAFKVDGKGIKDGYDGALAYNTLAGYSHIHFYSAHLCLDD